MKPTLIRTLFIAVAVILPFAYLFIVYPSLPDTIPLHYGANMEADRFGSKSELWLPISILMSASVISYLLITHIYLVDPKMEKNEPNIIITKLAGTIVFFFSAISIYIIYSTTQGAVSSFLFVLLGALFAVLGNLMYSIKPNYFIGMRLPWTLHDDNNWKLTHRLTGKIWVAGGFTIILLSFFFPEKWMMSIFLALVIIMVFVPAVYSFRLYQTKKWSSGR